MNNPSRLFLSILILTTLSGCTKREFQHSSSSMEPTIKRGEVISVDMKAYAGVSPSRWDVVLFESPLADGGNWASRVAGLPGETIDIRSGRLVIDGKELTLPPTLAIARYELPETNTVPGVKGPIAFPFRIPQGGYFVLGDNTSNALDSRYWGALEEAKILGKVPGK
jgi:signal peptidase I